MTNSTTFQAEKINQHIVQWLHDYAINAKVKGFVVGISGGIDRGSGFERSRNIHIHG